MTASAPWDLIHPGRSRYCALPEWEVCTVYDEGTRRQFELRNTATGYVEVLPEKANSLYAALDFAEIRIVLLTGTTEHLSSFALELAERGGR